MPDQDQAPPITEAEQARREEAQGDDLALAREAIAAHDRVEAERNGIGEGIQDLGEPTDPTAIRERILRQLALLVTELERAGDSADVDRQAAHERQALPKRIADLAAAAAAIDALALEEYAGPDPATLARAAAALARCALALGQAKVVRARVIPDGPAGDGFEPTGQLAELRALPAGFEDLDPDALMNLAALIRPGQHLPPPPRLGHVTGHRGTRRT